MKLTCTECSLQKIGCMSGEGSETPDIMIISDRLSSEAFNAGKAFSDRVGGQIQTYLTTSGIDAKKVYLTNTVKGVVKPKMVVGIVSIRKCAPLLDIEIRSLQPKVIILMGATSYKNFHGRAVNGTHYYDDTYKCWVVYTHHALKPLISGSEGDFQHILDAFTLAQELVGKDKDILLPEPPIKIITTLQELLAFAITVQEDEEFGVDCETSGLIVFKEKLLTIGFANDRVVTGVIVTPDMLPTLQQIFSSIKHIGHHIKFDMQFLRKAGIIVKKPFFDTMLAHYVVDPLANSHELSSLGLMYLRTHFSKDLDYPTLFKDGITPEILQILVKRGALDAYLSFKLKSVFSPMIDKDYSRFFNTVIMPINSVLAEMEYNGISIDENELYATEKTLEYQLKSAESSLLGETIVQKFAKGEGLAEINLNSPKQMSTLLYKYVHLPVDKEKGKTTDKNVLEKINLSIDNPVVTKLLEYRNLAKLKDTYIQGIRDALVRSDNSRIHVSYHQTVAVTGRLSCFPAGTKVRKVCGHEGMGGTTSTYVPIEDIKVGDKVYTHLGKAFPVTKTIQNNYSGDLVKIILPWRGLPTISRKILVTPEHPFLTDHGWVHAKDITTSTVLYTYQDINPNYKQNTQHKRNGGPRKGSGVSRNPMDTELKKQLYTRNCRSFVQKYGMLKAKELARKCVNKCLVRGPIVRGSYAISYAKRPLLLKTVSNVCQGCYIKKVDSQLVVHHKDKNTLNNNDNNLQVLCYKCHNNLHKHPGTTTPQYNTKFSQVVKHNILARDNYTCTRCKSTDRLMVHHITRYEGTTLCICCHAKVHHGHPLEMNGIKPLLVSRKYFHGKVYNLAVAEAESYFVQGLIAHNCSKPNLQTIPKAVVNSSIIRKMFVSKPGYSLIEMDFRQLEFRVWCHLSKDTNMIRMIAQGGDIHKRMAAWTNKIKEEEVTEEQRQQAKEISFGLIYGMGVKTLADRCKISFEEALRIKEEFFSLFPDATIWIQQVADFGIKNNYVTTPFGRKIPILYNPNEQESVSSARRHAVNYPVQSTAAELTNLTGVYLKEMIDIAKYDATLLLNVHDSLIWEVRDDLVQDFKPHALQAIQKVSDILKFRTILAASFKKGKNLGEQTEL